MTDRTCSVDGCGRTGQLRRGWCDSHYQRWRLTGSPELAGKSWTNSICSIEGCTSRACSRSMCRSHYMKWWRAQIKSDWGAGSRLEQQFWWKVDKNNSGGCWLWTGANNGVYGRFAAGQAHRFAYELLNGPIPGDYVLDHLCRVTLCVNPEHLEVVTQGENVRRGYGPNVAVVRVRDWSQERTHCKNGHELTVENIYSPSNHPTWRLCRECQRAHRRAYYRRRLSSLP